MLWHFFRETAEQVLEVNTQLLLSPLGTEKYKVITSQEKLNKLLYHKVVEKSQEVLSFKLVLTKGRVHLRGIIREPEKVPWNLKLGEIYFNLSLVKEEVREDKLFVRVVKFSVFNPKKRLDWIRLIDRYSEKIRREILDGLCENSPLSEIEPFKVLAFDLNFILKKIPKEMKPLGKIKILNVSFERKKIIWYIESNFLQRSLLDLLGPEYIEVEKIDPTLDALRLLTDFPFDLLR
ncbi:MAG: hypothetical protein NZM25_02445 [Leptospiraceae bacterium]|nr:hypothetical protein [Leptospiraceae bacterium]MDW8307671.1 hypothetical protein [Leptospiraceae bacterium]